MGYSFAKSKSAKKGSKLSGTHFIYSRVLVTGVPGCGKTTLSKLWCKKYGWKYISLNEIVKTKKLYSKIDSDGARVADLVHLEAEVNRILSKTDKPVIIDGHLGCDLHLNAELIIVLRLNPKILKKRLTARKYSFEKIAQNVEAEILDYCAILSGKNYPKLKTFEIDATYKSRTSILNQMKLLLRAKKSRKGANPKIDWSQYLLE